MQNQQNQGQAAAAAAVPLPPLQQWQIDAHALGLNAAERELHRILCNVHSFTIGQYRTLREEGYGTIGDFRSWKHKEIHTLLTSLSNRPQNRGGQRFGDRRIKQVQALSWFVNDRFGRGLAIDLNEYEADPNVCIENAVLAADHSKDTSTVADKPEKFSYKEWISWEESFDTYLDSCTGVNGAPLSYIIRKDLPVGTQWDTLDAIQQRIYTPALQGYAFGIDTKTVLTYLKELCIATDAEVWIKNIKCGRNAMIALRNHYDGTDEAKKRVLESKAQIKHIFYKHEFSFSFEKFATALQKHFKVLERYEVSMYESDKVDLLFEKCQNNNPEFKTDVGICRSQCTTFIDAITFLKTSVSRIFPSNVGTGGRQHGGRGRRNISSVKSINGVDLSDFGKYFSSEEVQQIKSNDKGKKAWTNFLKDPRRKKAVGKKRNKGGRGDRKIQALEKRLKVAEDALNGGDGSSGGTSTTADMSTDEQRVVAATINGVMAASRHNTANDIQFPTNGRSVRSMQSGARSGASVASDVTFDHLGNPM